MHIASTKDTIHYFYTICVVPTYLKSIYCTVQHAHRIHKGHYTLLLHYLCCTSIPQIYLLYCTACTSHPQRILYTTFTLYVLYRHTSNLSTVLYSMHIASTKDTIHYFYTICVVPAYLKSIYCTVQHAHRIHKGHYTLLLHYLCCTGIPQIYLLYCTTCTSTAVLLLLYREGFGPRHEAGPWQFCCYHLDRPAFDEGLIFGRMLRAHPSSIVTEDLYILLACTTVLLRT